jgi:hypothetical protein
MERDLERESRMGHRGRLTDDDLPLPADDPDLTRLEDAEPDFTDEPLDTDPQDAVEDGDVYFPPTDPVVTTDRFGQAEVLGGTSPSATDPGVEPARSAEDLQPGDDALEDAIREELRLDATTTDLSPAVRIRVDEGVAYLSGIVPTLEDAENVEAVAANVPGVLDVVEDLTVRDI